MSFVDNERNVAIPAQTIQAEGQHPVAPAGYDDPSNPPKVGTKVFVGWTDDQGLLIDLSTVSAAITLYAKYEIPVHTVRFIDDGREIDTQTVEQESFALAPTEYQTNAAPVRTDAEQYENVFVGWTVDGAAADPSVYAITKDTDFTAKYERKPFTVRFLDLFKRSAGQELIDSQQIDETHRTLVKPGDTGRPDSGETFMGWGFDESAALTDAELAAIRTSTNLYAVYALKGVTVRKVWNDDHNHDAKRPDQVTFQLYWAVGNGKPQPATAQSGVLGHNAQGTFTLTRSDEIAGQPDVWAREAWTELRRYQDDALITYTVREEPLETALGYNTGNGMPAVEYALNDAGLLATVTNTRASDVRSVAIQLNWVNEDQTTASVERPAFSVILYADGQPKATVSSTDVGWSKTETQWTYTFENQYVSNGQQDIVYTARELTAHGAELANGALGAYIAQCEGLQITNTLQFKTLQITKQWVHPANVALPNALGLTVYDGAKPVLTVSPKWNRQGDQWSTELILPKWNANSQTIEYTIAEESLSDYRATPQAAPVRNPNGADAFALRNIALIALTVEKTWEDGENALSTRPDKLTLLLQRSTDQGATYADVEERTLTEADAAAKDRWSYAYEDANRLPYADPATGTPYQYRVVETSAEKNGTVYSVQGGRLEGFSGSDGLVYRYTVSYDDPLHVTNTLRRDLTVTQNWRVPNGYLPGEPTLRLADQNGVRNETPARTANAATQWTYTYADLPAFDGTTMIVYDVSETAIGGAAVGADGYTADLQDATYGNVCYQVAAASGSERQFNATLCHTLEGSLRWADNDNAYATRPVEVTLALYGVDAQGAETLLGTQTTSVDASDAQPFQFARVDAGYPGYLVRETGAKLADQQLVTPETRNNELLLAGYAVEANGLELTHRLATTRISGLKLWQDGTETAARVFPTLNLQNGANTVSYRAQDLVWRVEGQALPADEAALRDPLNHRFTYEIANLPLYDGANRALTYTVSEQPVTGYGTTQTGNDFTNTLQRDVTVALHWVDGDGYYRPASGELKLELQANGTKVAETIVDDLTQKDWTHVFAAIPAYDASGAIVYTVAQPTTPGNGRYTATLNGLEVTNTASVRVTFYGNSNVVLASQLLTMGGDAATPAAPEIAGYDFAGWTGGVWQHVTRDQMVFAVYSLRRSDAEDTADAQTQANEKQTTFLTGQVPLAGGTIQNVGDCID